MTRGELREELAKYPTKDELAFHLQGWADRLIVLFRAELQELRDDLRQEVGALGTQVGALAAQVNTLAAQVSTLATDLGAELGRHVRAANEEMRDWMRAFDDRYKDLPPRVDKLEAKVFAPKRRRR